MRLDRRPAGLAAVASWRRAEDADRELGRVDDVLRRGRGSRGLAKAKERELCVTSEVFDDERSVQRNVLRRRVRPVVDLVGRAPAEPLLEPLCRTRGGRICTWGSRGTCASRARRSRLR